jgi:hypothetical protein
MLLDEKGLSVLSKNGCATGVRRDQREKKEKAGDVCEEKMQDSKHVKGLISVCRCEGRRGS